MAPEEEAVKAALANQAEQRLGKKFTAQTGLPAGDPDKIRAFFQQLQHLAKAGNLEEEYGLTPGVAANIIERGLQSIPGSEKTMSDISAKHRIEDLRSSAMGTSPKVAHIRSAKAPPEEE